MITVNPYLADFIQNQKEVSLQRQALRHLKLPIINGVLLPYTLNNTLI